MSSPAQPGLESEIPYTVRRSDRARRVRVSVDEEGAVEVVLPRRAPEREAAAAIAGFRPWIDRRRAQAAEARAAVRARGATVPYLGAVLRLVPEPGRRRAHRRGEDLLVPGGDSRAALERWYRLQARREIAARLAAATAAAGTAYESLSIRGQRTRWASCSANGAMSFNWRLMLAPEPVLDYVVWHEVCHLEVLDHSPRFWALVESRCPGHRRPKAWLRRHGATLVL